MTALPKTFEVVRRWAVKAEHTLDLKTDCPFDLACFHT